MGESPSDVAQQREDRIIAVVLALDEGEVTTYGDIAAVAGYPRNSRLVGRILGDAPDTHPDLELPWWRVVNANGHLRTSDTRTHTELLRSEDVTVRNRRVVDAPIGRFARHPDGPG